MMYRSLAARTAVVASLLATLAASASAELAVEKALTPHSAEYSVKISLLSGRLTTELRSTAGNYSATHVISPVGLASIVRSGSITEMSVFRRTEGGVRPLHYQSSDTLSNDRTDATVDFDWDDNELTGTVNGEPVAFELDKLVHDRVSIQYELMRDLLNGGASEEYVLYDIDELKTLTVRNIGRKRVSVAAGEFEAVGIQHRAGNSSRITTLWCVEELGFLPVIIEQHRNGKLRVRATLDSYEPTRT